MVRSSYGLMNRMAALRALEWNADGLKTRVTSEHQHKSKNVATYRIPCAFRLKRNFSPLYVLNESFSSARDIREQVASLPPRKRGPSYSTLVLPSCLVFRPLFLWE